MTRPTNCAPLTARGCVSTKRPKRSPPHPMPLPNFDAARAETERLHVIDGLLRLALSRGEQRELVLI